MTIPVWISEADVVAALHLVEAVDTLEAGLRAEAAGAARNMVKTQVAWNGGTLHALGAVFESVGILGTKTWSHTASGATPLLILWDADTSKLLAVIEAFALGQMRTGSMSGVATRWLSREDADVMAITGTGKQAITQIAAVAAVRRLREVRVFSPTPAHRAALCENLRSIGFACRIVDCFSLDDAVSPAGIVTLATRAREPFLAAELLQPGTHVNAIGAITAERAEFHQALFDRAAAVVVDSVSAVRKYSAEFICRFGTDDAAWSGVQSICKVVAARRGRPQGADLTIFKSVGMGISDLALGVEVFSRVRTAGGGRPFDQPKRIAPRLVMNHGSMGT